MQFSKEKLLPNGSIVLLKGGTKKVVIYGRKQLLMVEEPVMYDYIGCFYPEGYIDPDYTFVFNHDAIEEIIFVGFIDEEEEAFVGLLNWMWFRNRWPSNSDKTSNLHTELGQIISREKAGRENDEEITIFKSVSLAVVDIIVANYLYGNAVECGMGNRIEFWDCLLVVFFA